MSTNVQGGATGEEGTPDAVTTIKDPTAWPTVLVGPMVRRVDNTSAAVFVATRAAANLELRIYDGVSPAGGRQPIATAATATVAIGQRLHVAVIRATGLNLSTDTLYGYDVAVQEIGPANAPFETLDDLGLLSGATPLGYVAQDLPGFILPTTRDNLRILYGSCRKPHGEGPDMMPVFDQLIEESRLDEDVRPQQLFLTGDQIYADDVAPGMLPALTEAAAALLGWTEQLPNLTGAPTYDATNPVVRPGFRSIFLRDQKVQDKTSYSANHLLFFGEWCAMYLMAWSTAIWKPYAPLPFAIPYTYELAGDQLQNTAYSPATRRAVLFAESLDRTRRALANVATYMIFDDHEVTDDWNLNQRVSEKLRTTEMGRRLVRNALCSYAVFQDWGNQPDDYLPGTKGADIIDGLTVSTTTAPVPQPTIGSTPDALDYVLDIGELHLTSNYASDRKLWHYSVRGPGHAAVVLDTRTWRSYPDPVYPPAWPQTEYLMEAWSTGEIGKQLNCGLIGSGAMQLQLGLLNNALADDDFGSGRQPMVISPAPVLGSPLVESLQAAGVIKELNVGQTASAAEKYDNEPWSGDGAAYMELLDSLVPYSPVIFVSGDVHYAFTNVAHYRLGSQVARFVQLTSSPCKNSTFLANASSVPELIVDERLSDGFSMVYTADAIYSQGPELYFAWLQSHWDERRSHPAWSLQLDPLRDKLDDYVDTVLKLEVPPLTWYKRPMHMVAAGAITRSEWQQLWDLWDPAFGPNREMYTETALDLRSMSERDDHDQVLENELDGYPAHFREAVLDRNRGWVAVNNVGDISFLTDDDGIDVVRNDLYWRHNNQPILDFQTRRPVLTRHEVSLRNQNLVLDRDVWQ